eukprot:scaffold27386_cov53-Attheya_sp.AAC.2
MSLVSKSRESVSPLVSDQQVTIRWRALLSFCYLSSRPPAVNVLIGGTDREAMILLCVCIIVIA